MEFVEEAMDDGGEKDADDGDESDTTEEGVNAGKDFAGVGFQVGRGAHAGKDHGGVAESVHPRHLFEGVIADHADEQ